MAKRKQPNGDGGMKVNRIPNPKANSTKGRLPDFYGSRSARTGSTTRPRVSTYNANVEQGIMAPMAPNIEQRVMAPMAPNVEQGIMAPMAPNVEQRLKPTSLDIKRELNGTEQFTRELAGRIAKTKSRPIGKNKRGNK